MVTIVGIRFKRVGKIYYFAPGSFDLQKGDHTIVETARGVEYGEVVMGPQEVDEKSIVSPLKSVIRKADERDARKVEENHRKEKEAFTICEKKIAARKLEMRLVNVEYTFDGGRIIFYFTADGRIDFRNLVKDLAAVFRTRIELRQIGVRDEAKMLGGIGCCGRPLCCATFWETLNLSPSRWQRSRTCPLIRRRFQEFADGSCAALSTKVKCTAAAAARTRGKRRKQVTLFLNRA